MRRKEGVLDTSRMSLVRGVRTVDEFKHQRATVSHDLNKGGVVADGPVFGDGSRG